MKRWLCGALAALMALTTGCSAILNRDYTSVTPHLSLIHISEPPRPEPISYAVFGV